MGILGQANTGKSGSPKPTPYASPSTRGRVLPNPDFAALFEQLNAHGCEYLLIGGYAVSTYSKPRYTKDIDVWAAGSRANMEQVMLALRDFGIPITAQVEANFTNHPTVLVMGIEPNRIDVLNNIPGVDFAEAYRRRVQIQFGDTRINVISKLDLIANKRASGRPENQLDVVALLNAKS